MTDDSLFARTVLPVANPEDARSTAGGLRPYLSAGDTVLVVHVAEKGGGVPDKTPVEQSEAIAEQSFEEVRERLADLDVTVETAVMYSRDVAEAIFEAAREFRGSCVAFTPRDGSRWVRLLSGDISLSLVTENDRPVVVLPDEE